MIQCRACETSYEDKATSTIGATLLRILTSGRQQPGRDARFNRALEMQIGHGKQWRQRTSTRVHTCSTQDVDTEARLSSAPSIHPKIVRVILHAKLVTICFFIATHKRLTIPPRLDLACGNLTLVRVIIHASPRTSIAEKQD